MSDNPITTDRQIAALKPKESRFEVGVKGARASC